MKRILASLPLLLVSAAAFAVDPTEPPMEKASLVTVAIFLIASIGLSGFACWIVYKRDRANKAAQATEQRGGE
jgi:hypothetical protein